MAAVNLCASLAGGHLGRQLTVLFPGHVIAGILHTGCVKKILVVEEHIPVGTVGQSVGRVIVLQLLGSSVVHAEIVAVLLNQVVQRHELLFVRHLKHGAHILYPDYVGIRLCCGKADAQRIVVLVRVGVDDVDGHARILLHVSVNYRLELGGGGVVPCGHRQLACKSALSGLAGSAIGCLALGLGSSRCRCGLLCAAAAAGCQRYGHNRCKRCCCYFL